MQPNPTSLVNMATISTSNTSIEQDQLTVAQMWPNATLHTGGVLPSKDGAVMVPIKPGTMEALRKQLDDSVDRAKITMKIKAVKFDDGKVDWTLVPFEALEEMAQVLTFGAKKYDSWNWTTGGGFKWTRVLASTMRHLFAFIRGQDNDPESGLSHISHAQCNLLFLAYYIRDKKKFPNDDRYAR